MSYVVEVGEAMSAQAAMMDADVVADEVNRGHAGGGLAVDRLEQLDELDLTLAAAKDAADLTGARVGG